MTKRYKGPNKLSRYSAQDSAGYLRISILGGRISTDIKKVHTELSMAFQDNNLEQDSTIQNNIKILLICVGFYKLVYLMNKKGWIWQGRLHREYCPEAFRIWTLIMIVRKIYYTATVRIHGVQAVVACRDGSHNQSEDPNHAGAYTHGERRLRDTSLA